MCLATLSTGRESSYMLYCLLALPHPRGFISLTEQQQLATANQHAVSKGRLRWQLRARATLSACCHRIIMFTTGGTASHLAGRHACQQTLSPPHAQTHTRGEESWMKTTTLISVWCFSLLTPPSPLFLPPPLTNSPSLNCWKKSQNNNKQAAWFLLFVGGGWWRCPYLVFAWTMRCPHASCTEWMMQASRLPSHLSRCVMLHRVTDSFQRIRTPFRCVCLFTFQKTLGGLFLCLKLAALWIVH